IKPKDFNQFDNKDIIDRGAVMTDMQKLHQQNGDNMSNGKGSNEELKEKMVRKIQETKEFEMILNEMKQVMVEENKKQMVGHNKYFNPTMGNKNMLILKKMWSTNSLFVLSHMELTEDMTNEEYEKFDQLICDLVNAKKTQGKTIKNRYLQFNRTHETRDGKFIFYNNISSGNMSALEEPQSTSQSTVPANGKDNISPEPKKLSKADSQGSEQSKRMSMKKGLVADDTDLINKINAIEHQHMHTTEFLVSLNNNSKRKTLTANGALPGSNDTTPTSDDNDLIRVNGNATVYVHPDGAALPQQAVLIHTQQSDPHRAAGRYDPYRSLLRGPSSQPIQTVAQNSSKKSADKNNLNTSLTFLLGAAIVCVGVIVAYRWFVADDYNENASQGVTGDNTWTRLRQGRPLRIPFTLHKLKRHQ
ncbi:hypothetical protein RFI_29585, partial [Reticulomyxa filosa]